MNPFQSIIGAIMARQNLSNVNNNVASSLDNKIGPTGIQGQHNYDNNYSQMMRYMNQGDPQSAVTYARGQQQKVGANTPAIHVPQAQAIQRNIK